MGHILNLSVHSFLFVTDLENLEDDELGTTELRAQLKLLGEWRKKGPLGKIHNFIVYLQASPQRMQKFLSLSKGKRLSRDNKTRWNSQARALKIATSHPYYEAIKAYFEEYIDEDCRLDELSEEEWELLQHIQEFLDAISQTTKALESNLVTLDNVLPAMDFILTQFKEGKKRFKDHSQFSKMFNSGWAKLNKYYMLTKDTPIYVAALVLNPSHKWNYIQRNWDQRKWVEDAKKIMQAFWDGYKPQGVNVAAPQSSPKTDNKFLLFLQEQEEIVEVIKDEYAHYCAQPTVKIHNARDWWLHPTQQ